MNIFRMIKHYFWVRKNTRVIRLGGVGELSELLKMFAWIEYLGAVGHSASFKVFADGDGNTRWKFTFGNKDMQRAYDSVKTALRERRKNKLGDIDSFSI